jgi:glucose-1-phosphate adenylyltransferase
MLDKTLTIILAGGSGGRLKPLTDERAKAAIPFGGKYRLIDFTLANCLNSGLRQVLILTQHKSHSLLKHLRDGWSIFNPEIGEHITAVPPQMRAGENWNSGTANAIYHIRDLLERSAAQWALVLMGGDQVYRMDYEPLIAAHVSRGAAATIVYIDLSSERIQDFDAIELDNNTYRVLRLGGQPQEWDGHRSGGSDGTARVLVSMGVYVVSMELLLKCLEEDYANQESAHDFCRDVIPSLTNYNAVYGYHFGGPGGRVNVDKYWQDVSTIDSYYEANMALLNPVPPINLYQTNWQIRTYPGQHPPARTVPGKSGTEGICINSIVAGGVVISGGSAQHSILFAKTFLDDESIVQDSILFEGVRIGEGAQLRNCIVDKFVNIPAGESVGYDLNKDRQRFTVSNNGIVVIPRAYKFE